MATLDKPVGGEQVACEVCLRAIRGPRSIAR